MKTTITLQEYLSKGKTFVIPDYQRGYIWGQEGRSKTNAVEYLMNDLIQRYENRFEVFLQGVTVTEYEDEIILIDGQQRTTFLYLLLKWLGYSEKFDIMYKVREASSKFLKELNLEDIEADENEPYQDHYFFKKTLRIIADKLQDIDKEAFLDFVLKNVIFLYINVPNEEQAKRVFTMMNGNKAVMKQEEIIKAEILRLASLSEEKSGGIAHEWELNVLRSRYAREWDKWLHWWNREDVKRLFKCDNTMGLLISTYLSMKTKEVLNFESFRNSCLPNGTPYDAKMAFDGLRRLQKQFEDAFTNPITHNQIGAILLIMREDDERKFVQHYFVNKQNDEKALKDYYMLAFLGMTHDEIINIKKGAKSFSEKYENTWNALNDDFLYIQNKEKAFRFLLRLNIDEDIKQERAFIFDIWSNRSLEHIYPKSKVGHQDEEGKWFRGDDEECSEEDITLKREDITTADGLTTTEHSIGNLVLLYRNENSKFNNSDFEEKKIMFFNPSRKELFKSRHLLHTICVFAERGSWNGAAISENKKAMIDKFEKDYKELKEKYDE